MVTLIRKLIPQKDSQAFWLSFIVCLAACYSILFIVSPVTGLSKNFGAGNDGYIQLARSIVAGDGYVFEKDGPQVFHRPPVYSLFLVPVALFPENLQRYIIVIPQSLLVGFIGMLIFKIASRLFDINVAKIAIFIFLLNPWVYWNAKNPMTAILQTFLYLVFAYLIFVELFEKTNRFKPIFSILMIGVTGALLILTHATMLPVVGLLIVILFIKAILKSRDRIFTAILAGVMVICLVAPWTYRNYVVFHKFIPVAGGGGLGYFNGLVQWNIDPNCTQRANEGYIDASMRLAGIAGSETVSTHWKGFTDVSMEETMNRRAAEHLRKNPVLFVKKVLLNVVGFYFPVLPYHYLANKNVSVENILMTLFHLGLWFLGLIAVWSAKKNKQWRLSVALVVFGIVFYAVWFLPFTVFIGHSLYTLGTIPFLSILAAVGITRFLCAS